VRSIPLVASIRLHPALRAVASAARDERTTDADAAVALVNDERGKSTPGPAFVSDRNVVCRQEPEHEVVIGCDQDASAGIREQAVDAAV